MLSASRSPRLHYASEPLDPTVDLLDLFPGDDPDAIFLACPAEGVTIAGYGVAAEIQAAGRGRFVRAADEARALFARLTPAGVSGPPPLLLGGFGFADADPRDERWRGFPALRMIIPATLLIQRPDGAWRIRTWSTDGGADPVARHDARAASTTPHASSGKASPSAFMASAAAPSSSAWRRKPRAGADWHARVAHALDAIARGTLEKIVLARSRDVERDGAAWSADALRTVVRHLRDRRPGCTTFWIGRGDTTFVGSSPETLVRRHGRLLEAMALAGSAPRDADPALDAAAGAALAACPKNAAEHALVADEVRTTLQRLCTDVDEPERRELRRFPEAFHLATSFRGTLDRDVSAIEAAGALHPTPAVCGLPRERAHAVIAAEEPERGWYAGGIGWTDAAGDGHFSVALRCALVQAQTATVWAGAGIVAGSDAARELDETEIKMRAMADALAGAGRAA